MRKELIFTGITSQGGLLPADFLAALSDPKSRIEGLDPVTFRLAPGERLGEQVNRSWNRLKGCWANFQRALAAKEPGDPTTTETRERWLLPLFQELDFGRLTAVKPLEIDGRTYAVSHGWGPVPIHLVGSHVDLDRRTQGAVGAAKTSPHSLVQQVLNASDDHLWGIISNGFILRLLRDNLALTRQAYVEWDLQAIFDGDLYPEFFLLWLTCHQSRFEVPPGIRPEQCWLEKWRKQAEDTGLRALENLRPGVEQAIAALGTGLISHKSNQALRVKLSTGQLSTQDFYRQVLRLIYRLLFLLVAEDRSLLHPFLPSEEDGKDALEKAIQARRRYDEFYSISRLRFLTRRRAGTPHPDLWQVFQFVTGKLGSDAGCPDLALPALGSFLWRMESTPDMNACQVSNRLFLEAVHALAFIRDGDVRRIIDYKNLGSEELGSVYESLLELHPIVNADAGTFELRTAAGHERKTSGSYYTPDSLVQCLLDSALEPVMDEAVKGKEGIAVAEALLKLKICDPAVGSGHFLIAAAHRLAKRIAAARTGEEEPSPEATRTALREVIGRCLYGVDINPMAAELCKVSLWLEALEPGKPLSFLDHHIQVGNSLLGATPELMANGLPDDAFNPIEGDKKEICLRLKKTNKAERSGQKAMFTKYNTNGTESGLDLARAASEVNALPDGTPCAVHEKQVRYIALRDSGAFQLSKLLADAWCAAFVWKKTDEFPYAITTGVLRELESNLGSIPSWLQTEIARLAEQYSFFHWHLAFPEIFGTNGGLQRENSEVDFHSPITLRNPPSSGFDCILGNPPWEKVQLEEKQFFEIRCPDIARAKSSERWKLIRQLSVIDPSLWKEWTRTLESREGEVHFLKHSGRFQFGAKGNLNTYALFLEVSIQFLSQNGFCGIIIPSGIATDDSKKHFFQYLVDSRLLRCLYDFENKGIFFPEVHSSYKFCLLTAGKVMHLAVENPEFVFFSHDVNDLHELNRRFILSVEDIALLNPNTFNCPTFRNRKDAELTKAIYMRHQVIECSSAPCASWRGESRQMLNITHDSESFRTELELRNSGAIPSSDENFIVEHTDQKWLRLYEGKMVGFFDHRQASVSYRSDVSYRTTSVEATTLSEHSSPSFSVIPQFWVEEARVNSAIPSWYKNQWFIGFKRITSSTNERTMIAAVIPRAGMIDALPVIYLRGDASDHVKLLANLNSFALDYVARSKVGGLQISHFIYKQLPAIAPQLYFNNLLNTGPISNFILSRVLELSYTSWDLEYFAKSCGWTGPPFRWGEERRFLLRCELDAAFFHLYLPAEVNGEWRLARKVDACPYDETSEQLAELKKHFPTPRDAAAYIMDTFPIVRRKDEEQYDGDYRTKRVILEIYDAMQESIRTGRPYQTHLNPPPGPPCDAHGHFLSLPDWKPGQPRPADWPPHVHPPKGVLPGS